MVNYYTEFGINQTMTTDEIGSILKREHRKWTTRQNSPDDSVRSIAQQKLSYLNEAVLVFCDNMKKNQYDNELKKAPEATVVDQPRSNPQRSYINVNSVDRNDLCNVAETCYNEGNSQLAIDLCKRGFSLGLMDFKLYFVLGMSYYDLNDTENSLATFQIASKMFGKDASSLEIIALVFIRYFNSLDEAQAVVNKMAALNSDPCDALQVEIDMRCNRLDQAESLISDHMAKKPNDTRFLANAADACLALSDTFFTNAQNGGEYLDSVEAYHNMLTYREKAKSLDPSPKNLEHYNNTVKLGKRRYNKDNLLGTVLFCIFWIPYSLIPAAFLIYFSFAEYFAVREHPSRCSLSSLHALN